MTEIYVISIHEISKDAFHLTSFVTNVFLLCTFSHIAVTVYFQYLKTFAAFATLFLYVLYKVLDKVLTDNNCTFPLCPCYDHHDDHHDDDSNTAYLTGPYRQAKEKPD